MTSKVIAYHNILKLLNNHCLAFTVFSTLEVKGNNSVFNQLYIGSLLAGNAVDQPSSRFNDPQGSPKIDTKSNTNMHYEHTFLHNLLPKKS